MSILRRPPRDALRRLWDWLPTAPLMIGLLWAAGLALGLLAFRASLWLPSWAAAALWSLPVGLGLLSALRAEPLLWEPRAPDSPDADTTDPGPLPPAEPTRPAVSPLFESLSLPGGRFRMGTPPPTDAEIALYAKDLSEAQLRRRSWSIPGLAGACRGHPRAVSPGCARRAGP